MCLFARARFDRDLRVFGMTAMDTLDYAGPRVDEGSKGVLLGVGEAVRELPRAWSGAPPDGFAEARAYCDGCLVVSGPSYDAERDAASRLASDARIGAWPFVALVDDAVKTAASEASFLWTVFTRFDPSADLHARATRLLGHHVAYDAPIVLDARMKPWYPKVVEAAPETEALVTRRWREYFPKDWG